MADELERIITEDVVDAGEVWVISKDGVPVAAVVRYEDLAALRDAVGESR